MKGLSFLESIRETKKVNSRAGPEGWGGGGSMSKSVHFERMRIWVRIPSTCCVGLLPQHWVDSENFLASQPSPKMSWWFNERPCFKTVRWRMTGRHLTPSSGPPQWAQVPPRLHVCTTYIHNTYAHTKENELGYSSVVELSVWEALGQFQ